MDTTLLQDTFKYFAKFPAFAGVQKNFNVSESKRFGTDYSNFQTSIDNLDEKDLIPGIADYIFGVDEDMVKRRIQSISGIFLFVDYGAINIDQEGDALYEMNEFRIAITVAFPIKENTLDPVETMLMHQTMLDYMAQIKDKMRQDKKKIDLIKEIKFPLEINPWFSRELMNSSGWSMLFSRQGVGMV